MKKVKTMTIKFFDLRDGNVKGTVYAGTNNYLFDITGPDRISVLSRITLRLLSNDHTVEDAVNESLARRSE